MIPLVEEPAEEHRIFGIYENCHFCKTPTKYWHVRTNQPICKDCAKVRKVSEIPKCHPDYKPPTKAEYIKNN